MRVVVKARGQTLTEEGDESGGEGPGTDTH